jgi:translation initiation factor IF-2
MLLAAKIPYIVVFTKADLPTKNVEKAKQQLAGEGIMLEGLGGDVPFLEVSAQTNLNVKELLDLILLVSDLHKEEKQVSGSAPLEAIVIESKLDQKSGPRATVVVKNGKIDVRDEVSAEKVIFKVRTMITDRGEQVKSATIGDAVELLGMQQVLPVGSVVRAKDATTTTPQAVVKEPEVYKPHADVDALTVILAADTQGALEALTYALPEEANIISQKTGEITEADVLLAKSTGGIVLGFNSKVRPDVQKLAQTEKVLVRSYDIIYELIDEVKDVLEGKKLAQVEQVFGQAAVLAKFPFEKTTALGIRVLDGRVARGDKVRVLRDNEIMGEATLTSLRIGKEIASKAEKGKEAGIILTPYLDFQVGDVLLCHS